VAETLLQMPSSEKVAIARAIEEELKVKAAERQIALAGTRKEDCADLSNNCYEGQKGRSDEIAAEKAGFGSHMTYRRAKRVVDKGVPELVEAMDAGRREKARTGRARYVVAFLLVSIRSDS